MCLSAVFLFGIVSFLLTGNCIFVDLLLLFNQKGGIGLVEDTECMQSIYICSINNLNIFCPGKAQKQKEL